MVASNTTDCFELLHARSLEFLGVANVHVLKMFRVKKFRCPDGLRKFFNTKIFHMKYFQLE